MKNNKILVFAVVLILLVSMTSFAIAKSDNKTDVAVKKLKVSEKDGTYKIKFVLKNKFRHGDATVSYGLSIDGPSSGSGFGACCIVLEPKEKVKFVYFLVDPEPGEYTITASVSPQDRTDIKPRNNVKTITFTVD